MDRRIFLKATSATGALAWLLPTPLHALTPSNSYVTGVPFVLDPSLSGLSQADRRHPLRAQLRRHRHPAGRHLPAVGRVRRSPP